MYGLVTPCSRAFGRFSPGPTLDGQGAHADPFGLDNHDAALADLGIQGCHVGDEEGGEHSDPSAGVSPDQHHGRQLGAREGEDRDEVGIGCDYRAIFSQRPSEDRLVARLGHAEVEHVSDVVACLSEQWNQARRQIGVEEQPHAGRRGAARAPSLPPLRSGALR